MASTKLPQQVLHGRERTVCVKRIFLASCMPEGHRCHFLHPGLGNIEWSTSYRISRAMDLRGLVVNGLARKLEPRGLKTT